MDLENKKYHLAFSLIPAVGPTKFKRLNNHFSTLKQAWQADLSEYLKSGLDEKTSQEIIESRNKINLDEQLEFLKKENISLVSLEDEDYPQLLKETYGPPFVLFYQGKLKDERDEFSLSVVGTRRMSPYGKQVTGALTSDLARNNLVIVSGLALGIDSEAHQAALTEKARTIAVVGSGLSAKVFYPKANLNLAKKIIAEDGLILSEYPPLVEPQKFFFPQRNRIVSGLSLGTLVIEAPINSGALLTARLALEQNREVFAVPGSIFQANCLGPNNLLKMGARAVTTAEDLILKNLSHEPMHVDELKRLTKLDTNVINSTLTLMEMKGKARNLGGMMYVLAR